ncbi:MAG: N-6 DNA methylase [Myxococcales bacterium]|nr:N-6 DNA methylase [Myxococcales bacterium]
MPKRHRPGVSAASVLRHVEEVVIATSGEDAFEIVFAVAAARIAVEAGLPLRRAIDEAVRRHPMLEVDPVSEASDALLMQVDELLARALPDEGTLDAVFESLVPRVSKSDKGQFFTPRHVVDFVVRMLAPSEHEVVVDPACGSGAFLSHARAAGAQAHGSDVDVRAVRVARLLALAASADPRTVQRADGLRGAELPVADVVATNPPFAGRAASDGFEVAGFVRNPERDVLFLERALALLRPGGRLGIVLPYNKASGAAFASLRRWLVERARVLAIVGLPRETFLPHTSQRTFVLFAQKRPHVERPVAPSPDELTMFVISERAGKDTGGEPILRSDGELDHDLDDVASTLRPFLEGEGFA